jgi:hypothetical protein
LATERRGLWVPETARDAWIRNTAEFAGIIALWLVSLYVVRNLQFNPTLFAWLVVFLCWCKTSFFGTENLIQLRYAAANNTSHHRFLMWMGINMAQMITSFAFDFHILYNIQTNSFAGIAKNIDPNEALFDCFYLSTLNFSFFGYSDILPQTVPAKVVNLTEILIAFVTVIFFLSDYISLKDSIHPDRKG